MGILSLFPEEGEKVNGPVIWQRSVAIDSRSYSYNSPHPSGIPLSPVQIIYYINQIKSSQLVEPKLTWRPILSKVMAKIFLNQLLILGATIFEYLFEDTETPEIKWQE